jgi:hypothetical protein
LPSIPPSFSQSKDHNLRCAVIVNDVGALNIDASLLKSHNVTQTKEKIVQVRSLSSRAAVSEPLSFPQMENGCICCTLRGDLLEEIARLADSKAFDYLIIESSAASPPCFPTRLSSTIDLVFFVLAPASWSLGTSTSRRVVCARVRRYAYPGSGRAEGRGGSCPVGGEAAGDRQGESALRAKQRVREEQDDPFAHATFLGPRRVLLAQPSRDLGCRWTASRRSSRCSFGLTPLSIFCVDSGSLTLLVSADLRHIDRRVPNFR